MYFPMFTTRKRARLGPHTTDAKRKNRSVFQWSLFLTVSPSSYLFVFFFVFLSLILDIVVEHVLVFEQKE